MLAVLKHLLLVTTIGASFAWMWVCSQLKRTQSLKAQSWWRQAQLVGFFRAAWLFSSQPSAWD